MRVRIEGRPGELEVRGGDVLSAIQKLMGDCCDGSLEKARQPPQTRDQAPRKLDLPALQGSVDRARKAADRIQAKMAADMAAVLKAAR